MQTNEEEEEEKGFIFLSQGRPRRLLRKAKALEWALENLESMGSDLVSALRSRPRKLGSDAIFVLNVMYSLSTLGVSARN